jgi:hypothetical protein
MVGGAHPTKSRIDQRFLKHCPRFAMKPFRFTIASLSIAVAVVGLDTVWLKYMLTNHSSAFGFVAEGADLGILLMANVLPFGLHPMLVRRGERRRFLIGFEVGGLAAALTYACCTWLAPDAVLRVASFILDPVWDLLFGWVRTDTIEGFVIDVVFLTVGFGVPQLFVAIVCGIQARRIFSRRSDASRGLDNTVVRALRATLASLRIPFRSRHQGPKSNRTSPSSSLRRASNGLPAFDSKPLSTGLRPWRSSACAVRTPIFLPAIVFQIANLHPRDQPLQP